MKTTIATLCVALIAVFALSACGGGNNATSNSSSSSSSSEKTPAEKRQAAVDAMVAAFNKLDADALKAVWLPSEHQLLQDRILKEFPGIKEGGGSWTVKPTAIEEKDGKFVFSTEQIIKPMKDGPEETETRPGAVVEHEGKWVISFGK